MLLSRTEKHARKWAVSYPPGEKSGDAPFQWDNLSRIQELLELCTILDPGIPLEITLLKWGMRVIIYSNSIVYLRNFDGGVETT